jgi:hypothetical protein
MRWLVLATAAAAACGVDAVSVDDYASAARDAACRHLVECGEIEDLETCRRLDIGVRVRLSATERAAIDMGLVELDGENARRCFDALAERSCDTTSESSRVLPDACRNILVGAQRDGEICTENEQCVSRQCAQQECNAACCLGSCAGGSAPPRAGAGESCEFAACEDSAYCDEAIMMCAARRPRDAFCTSSEECAIGLGCLPGGVCATLPTLGQACTSQCRDEGTTCGSTGTCVEVKLAGEMCTTSADCARVYQCDPSKQCRAGLPLGAPCSPAQRCADDGAFCDVPPDEQLGVCALPKPDGAPCQSEAHCQSLTCDPSTRLCVPEPVCL